MSGGHEKVIIKSLLRYTIAVVAIVVAFLLRQAMVGYLGAELPPYITFYPVVMLVAMLAGLGPGLLATMVAALLAGYWILPPQGQFAIAKTSDVIALSFFSGMGAFISLVAELYRRARRKATAYDEELAALRGTQEALRQSEERLRGAVMAAEIGVWNWNPETGKVVVSAHWKRVFGVADDTAVTFDTWRNALHPEDRDRTVNALMTAIEQRHLWDPAPEYNVDYRVIWPNGTVRWVVDRGRATYDETGRPISMSGINVDITARKLVEEKIAHLASFPALNPSPIFEIDLEGKITYANLAAQWQLPGLVELGTEPPLLRDWASVLTVFRAGSKQTITREVEAEGATFLQTIHYAPEMGLLRAYLVDITERKRAETEMAEARSQAELTAAQLHTIVDTVSAGVHVRDADGYVVLQNEAARNIYGTNQQMVLPHVSEMSKMIETFELDGRPVPFSEWPMSRILRGECVRSAEMRVRLKGVDKERILCYSGSPVLDSNGKLVMAVMTSEDITERKRSDETLQETQKQLSLFIEHAPVALAMFDRDMRYLHASRYWLNTYNIGNRDLRGLSHYEVFPEIGEEWKKAHCRGLVGEVLRSEGDRFERVDGSVQWVRWQIRPWHSAAGTIGGIVIFSEDITERKQAEEALRESEERFRALVTASSDAVYRMSPDWSEMRQLRGRGFIADTEAPSRTWLREYIHPDDQSRVMAVINEAIRTKSIFELEHRVLRVDGSVGWTFSRAIPLQDANGEIVEWFGAASDITNRKQAEEALRAALAEKTELLKEVHHRVKNNLQIVASLLNLQARQAKNPAALETLRDTQGRIRSMALLHETLYREGNAARVNCAVYFSHLCAHLCRAFSQLAERVRVRTDVAPVELGLDVAIPCGLIVNELVSNSFKHAFPDGRRGEITVRIRTQADGLVVLSVADDGIGLSSGVDYQQAGTMGMHLVTGLAKQIAAAIEVKSDPGTIVQISFLHSEKGKPVV